MNPPPFDPGFSAPPPNHLRRRPALLSGAVREGYVVQDRACRRCGYNLRSLSVDGRCPECGTLVALSIHGDLLRYADPRWVNTLQRGARLILVSFTLVIAGLLVIALVSAMRPDAATTVGTLVTLGVYAVALVGTWMLTEPDPSGIGESRHGRGRRFIRIFLLIGAVGVVLHSVGQSFSHHPLFRQFLQVSEFLAEMVSVVVTILFFLLLHDLALRVPDEELARRARRLGWTMGVASALLLLMTPGIPWIVTWSRALQLAVGCVVLLLFAVMLVAFLMSLLLLWRLDRTFGEQATAARLAWRRAETISKGPSTS